MPGEVSPYFYNTATNPMRFFRLRSPTFSLTATDLGGCQFRISGAGVPGCNYVIQASTNLTTWINLQTNPSPFIFIDSNACQYARRFYRAILAQQAAASPLPPPPAITVQPVGQPADYSATATFGATAAGAGSLSYQWRWNGITITGATNSSLNLSNLQFTNAGMYTVVVSNPGGSVTSSPAILNVAPKLLTQISGNALILSWTGPFILQSAAAPAGPYADVAGATSPYAYPTTSPEKFFRLRPQPFSLTTAMLPGGQFRVNCPGVPGCNFVIQSSTNLTAWINLQTNLSPFSFIDSDTSQYARRFYRAVLAR